MKWENIQNNLQIVGLYDFDFDASPLYVLEGERTLKPRNRKEDWHRSIAITGNQNMQG